MSAALHPGRRVEVRQARVGDARLALDAARLIEAAAQEYDIAVRDAGWLRDKILTGRAAVALVGKELVGYGCWSEWEGGNFVSHSALVVRPDMRGHKLARRMKMVLFQASRERFPGATLMSLTTSRLVKALNFSLGFKEVPLDRLTSDPAFWEGCRTCRNYEAVRRRGEKCCCGGMILEPEGTREQ